jgi:hypothetical protein
MNEKEGMFDRNGSALQPQTLQCHQIISFGAPKDDGSASARFSAHDITVFDFHFRMDGNQLPPRLSFGVKSSIRSNLIESPTYSA